MIILNKINFFSRKCHFKNIENICPMKFKHEFLPIFGMNFINLFIFKGAFQALLKLNFAIYTPKSGKRAASCARSEKCAEPSAAL